MAAPNVAVAQSEAADEAAALRLTWGALGCPQETGLYRAGDKEVHVKKIHIIVAENDPAALFTIVTSRPPFGPPEHMLGHRVA